MSCCVSLQRLLWCEEEGSGPEIEILAGCEGKCAALYIWEKFYDPDHTFDRGQFWDLLHDLNMSGINGFSFLVADNGGSTFVYPLPS